MITIAPEPCGRMLQAGNFSWQCTAKQPCNKCRPLGELMAEAAHCYWEFSDSWPWVLAWNLCLASMNGRAVDQFAGELHESYERGVMDADEVIEALR